MTEIKNIWKFVEIYTNLFYNSNNLLYNGGVLVSPILMMTADTSPVFTATVVIAGVSIVVGVLLLLILIFYLFGMIVSKAESRAKERAAKKANKNSAKGQGVPNVTPMPVPAAPSVAKPAMEVENGINGEVVAAIAAAVAMSEGPNAVVRSIKKKNVSGRNPWAAAAVADNTRPF